ncbi:hypothetical protein F7Q99_23185 [Streptomyces kaniharaensis]|uniref:Uncharacterized protein n=1 Tax=Streptomyces kaniharaensis TaxID=212423 RepID=A0A6N7KXV9_9ACTN|nr:DUF6191 domain-containing protein [Streptomyces kaniharaensis]MQS15088.1 hypothetical protein [Streptomyces kaniharaensis]
MIAGAAAVVAGLVLLAVWQIQGETMRRRRPERRSGSGTGLSTAGLEELHALFSADKQVQIEQRQEQLMLRDDAQAGAPPHFGVDLEAGVAVLPGMPVVPSGAGRAPTGGQDTDRR